MQEGLRRLDNEGAGVFNLHIFGADALKAGMIAAEDWAFLASEAVHYWFCQKERGLGHEPPICQVCGRKLALAGPGLPHAFVMVTGDCGDPRVALVSGLCGTCCGHGKRDPGALLADVTASYSRDFRVLDPAYFIAGKGRA
jgi:hypothetical protein